MERPASPPSKQLTFDQIIKQLPTLMTWIEQCNRLPLLQDILKNSHIEDAVCLDHLGSIFQTFTPENTIVPIDVFIALINDMTVKFDTAKNTTAWFTPLDRQNSIYVQKDTAAIHQSLYFHADFHGDVKSFAAFLQVLKNRNIINNDWQIRDNNKIVFLGDYIDRGFYGLEVLYTLIILKLYNPQSVYILRGNHENSNIYESYNWGELSKKLQSQHINENIFLSKLDAFFDTLPSALYIQIPNGNFLLFTHGAHNHDDITLKDFLHSPKNFNAFAFSDHQLSPTPFNTYAWSDYEPMDTANTEIPLNERKAGYLYYKIPTTAWMDEHAVDTIIHGHSHDQTQLWGRDFREQTHNPKGRVYGLPIAPDTTYGKTGNFTDDVYGKIMVYNNSRNHATEIALERHRIIPVRPTTPTVSAAPAAQASGERAPADTAPITQAQPTA